MSKEALDAWMAKHPRTYDFPEELLPAVRAVESAGDDRAVSKKGAVGPMQIVASAHGLEPSDVADPAVNLDVGARYLDKLHKQFGGDTTRALKAYNRGPTAERKREDTPPKETVDYVARIEQWKKDHPVNPDHTAGTTEVTAWQAKYPVLDWLGDKMAAGTAGGRKAVKALLPDVLAPAVDALTEPAAAADRVVKGAAYGDRLTTGSGETLQIKPDVVDAAMFAAPIASRALKFGKFIAEAPSVRAGSAAAQRGILGPADKYEMRDYDRLIRQGKTPEEVWKATQTYKTDEGHFIRIDDTKSVWAGTKAIRTARPDVAQKIDDAKEALQAYTEGRLPKTKKAWDLMQKVENKGGNEADFNLIIHDAEQDLHAPMLSSEAVPLNEVLHHPNLYYRHPELKNYKVRIGTQTELGQGVAGHHDVNNYEIVMNKAAWEDVNKDDYSRGLMLHEIQHAIDQGRVAKGENITIGTSADWIKRSRVAGGIPTSRDEALSIYYGDKGETRARYSEQTMDVPNKYAPYPMGDAYAPGTFDIPIADQLGIYSVDTKTIPPRPIRKNKFNIRSVPPDPKELKDLTKWFTAAPEYADSTLAPAIPVRRGVWSVPEVKDVLRNPDGYDTSTLHDALEAIRWLKKNRPKP